MPKVLRLISLEIQNKNTQDDPVATPQGMPLFVDQIRMHVVLDHEPVKFLAWQQKAGQIKTFIDGDNLSDARNGGTPQPLLYWSLADLTVYEADQGGTLSGLIDTSTDDWIQTVRLDHSSTGQTSRPQTIKIGGKSARGYLADGRNDVEYLLTFSVTDAPVMQDAAFFDTFLAGRGASDRLNASPKRGNFLKDKGKCKWICAIDGGGARGIFVLRMLEQLESYYDKPCAEMFDMFAGTSTGSIVAALLASGYSVRNTLSLYTDPRLRSRVFQPNQGRRHAFRYFDLRSLGPDAEDVTSLNAAIYAQRFSDLVEIDKGSEMVDKLINNIADQLMTPRYKKTGMKELLFQVFSRRSAGGRLAPTKLSECGKRGAPKDILITARDLHLNETTFFTAFHIPVKTNRPQDGEVKAAARPMLPRQTVVPTQTEWVTTGTYQSIFLKDAVEASASAPVFFSPRSQFTDGGVGAHNNPAFMAAIEALRFSNKSSTDPTLVLEPKYLPYRDGATPSGTVLWSFGTAYKVPGPEAEADIARLIGGSQALRQRTDTALFWLDLVVDNLMYGANQEQDFLCREVLKNEVKYLRFNVGLNRSTLDALGVLGDRDEILGAIRLDSLGEREFDLMDSVAKQFALFARNNDFGFDRGGFRMTGRQDVDIAAYASIVKQNFRVYE